MTNELVPELHDIGKLIDKKELSKEIPAFRAASHWFKDIDLGSENMPHPETLTWLGVIGHHSLKYLHSPPKTLQKYSFDSITLLARLQIADHFASSTSRVLEEQIEEEKGIQISGWNAFDTDTVQTIWNTSMIKLSGLPINNRKEVYQLLKYLQTDPDYVDLITKSKYGNFLTEIPEEKGFPRNVTSLKTHLELTGKVYRILEQSIGINPSAKSITYRGDEKKSAKEAENKWAFRLARCTVTFPQHPSRAHDLGIFLRLSQLMEEMEKDDHVLMHTLDRLWLFLPVEEGTPLDTVLKPLLDDGFIIEADVAEKELKGLDPGIFDKPGKEFKQYVLYPELPDKIKPPICELCQMRPGSMQVEKGGVYEQLCPVCAGFRSFSEEQHRFNRLGGEWEKSGIPVAWVKISLDYAVLPDILRGLFEKYIREKDKTIPGEEIDSLVRELRYTALMADFTRDYQTLLSSFYRTICKNWQVEDIGGDHPELLIIPVKEKGQAFLIADAFVEVFHQIFPECESASPVSISISISNAKYPFFEHWRNMEEPVNAINIQVLNRAKIQLSIPGYIELRNLKLEKSFRSSSKLHHAIAIKERTGSELLQKIDFLEDLHSIPELLKSHIEKGYSIDTILGYQKIADIGGQS